MKESNPSELVKQHSSCSYFVNEPQNAHMTVLRLIGCMFVLGNEVNLNRKDGFYPAEEPVGSLVVVVFLKQVLWIRY